MDVLIVGGGAAGYFAAIASAGADNEHRVVIAEAGAKPLRKVAISGGGRCNVTHHCFEPAELIKFYPRGARELRGPFSRFQPQDTVRWFESAGVRLKTESDGRMFPQSDSSQTIIDCLEDQRRRFDISLQTRTKIESIEKGVNRFNVSLSVERSGLGNSSKQFDAVVIASGSSPTGYELARKLGHTIVPCVPSLFTFKVKDRRIEDRAGISVEHATLALRVGAEKFSAAGPLLITHWGFSGPAVIRLSAWAARALAEQSYRATLLVNWLGDSTLEDALVQLRSEKETAGKRQVRSEPLFGLPKRLWQGICEAAAVGEDERWATVRADKMDDLARQLTQASFGVDGKGEFKDEFVTCGGVKLAEIDFRRMESKHVPGLYFAGEVLDIDGITGGFNFQSAWTTGWIAGTSIAERAEKI
ncbi:MAG: NAD(P)/FAD-dependent oxidoreductase [Bdellovibrionota bacterium]